MILPTELEHSGKVVCLLIRFHFGYSFRLDAAVGPENVKVFGNGVFCTLDHQLEVVSGGKWFFYRLERQAVIEDLLCHEPYNKILGSTTVDNKSLVLLEFGIIFVIFYSNRLGELFHLLVIFILLLFFRLKVPVNVFWIDSREFLINLLLLSIYHRLWDQQLFIMQVDLTVNIFALINTINVDKHIIILIKSKILSGLLFIILNLFLRRLLHFYFARKK